MTKGYTNAIKDRLAQLEAENATLRKGLSAAKFFFDSPASFSHEEFQYQASQVYEALEGKPCKYTGKVPYLDKYADARAALRTAGEATQTVSSLVENLILNVQNNRFIPVPERTVMVPMLKAAHDNCEAALAAIRKVVTE